MIGFSTSSPVASVAVFDASGEVRYSAREEAPRRAGAACLAMLAASGVRVREARAFLADVGPGSFTGTRVGVVLAATLAWSNGAMTAGADAFDLIAPDADVAVPNRRGEWLVRRVGREPELLAAHDPSRLVGYAPELAERTLPDASRFALVWDRLELGPPMDLRPRPIVPPSISTPRGVISAG